VEARHARRGSQRIGDRLLHLLINRTVH